MCADVWEIFATTKKDLESGVAGVQEARWTRSLDLDLDDAENTRIGYPLHADPDVPVIMQRQVAAVQVVQWSCLRLCSSTVLKTFQLCKFHG